MANTKITRKLEEKRNSPAVQKFKTKIEEFFTIAKVDDEIKYKIKVDLAKKVDMPYYKENKGKRIYSKLSTLQIAEKYMDYLFTIKLEITQNVPTTHINDVNAFCKEFIDYISRQQGQTLRKICIISPKQKERHKNKRSNRDVYEHPVPVAYSKEILYNCIKNNNPDEAKKYLNFMHTKIPQIFMLEEDDKKVNALYKDTMPSEFNWQDENCNVFIRYEKAGIEKEKYLEN